MPTTTRPSMVWVVACAVGLAACASDDDGGDAGDTTVAALVVTSTTAPVSTTRPTATPTSSTRGPSDSAPSATVIDVTVGVDSAASRVETVPLGSSVRLQLSNPAADDEFHLHGYDIGADAAVPAGQQATFVFTADRAGDFELESHVTNEVYLVLEVR